ncbi:glycoside hydrolase family 108 protein, partial [Burkholderia glumae]
IGKLQWWEQVVSVEGFPKEPSPWHFHPIGIVGNFAQKSEEGCGDCAARFKKISKIILNHEGGIVDHKNDKGGLTNRGIAWPTWQKYAKEDLGVEPTVENLKALTESQAEVIYLKRFWEPKGFCQFRDDRIALMTYDWTITSGGAVTQIQKMLNSKYGAGVGEDGGLGPNTIKAINAVQDQDQLLQDIAEIRRKYYRMLVDNDSSQVVFLKGWLGRVDDCLQVKL